MYRSSLSLHGAGGRRKPKKSFLRDPGNMSKMDWEFFDQVLPLDGSKESISALKRCFSRGDGNGNGLISIAEVEKALMQTLNYDRTVKSALAPSVKRAHRVAKDDKKGGNNDFLDMSEFPAFVNFLRYDLHVLQVFASMDKDRDGHVTRQEFSRLTSRMSKKFGFPAQDDGEFDRLDADGGGYIRYKTFADSMLRHRARFGRLQQSQTGASSGAYADYKDDRLLAEGDTRVKGGGLSADTRVRGSVDSYADYAPPRDSTKKVVAAGDDSEAGGAPKTAPAKPSKPSKSDAAQRRTALSKSSVRKSKSTLSKANPPSWKRATLRATKKRGKRKPLMRDPNDMSTLSFAVFDAELPLDGSPESASKLEKVFDNGDGNKNGFLSLAEVEKTLMLALGYGKPTRIKVAKSVRRAHRATRGTNAGKNEDYVEKAEWPLFVAFFRYDLHILQLFCRADTDADGRVSRDEFKRYYKRAHKKLRLPPVDDSRLGVLFNEFDSDGGGWVRYDEFANWMMQHRIKNPDECILRCREAARIKMIPQNAKFASILKTREKHRLAVKGRAAAAGAKKVAIPPPSRRAKPTKSKAATRSKKRSVPRRAPNSERKVAREQQIKLPDFPLTPSASMSFSSFKGGLNLSKALASTVGSATSEGARAMPAPIEKLDFENLLNEQKRIETLDARVRSLEGELVDVRASKDEQRKSYEGRIEMQEKEAANMLRERDDKASQERARVSKEMEGLRERNATLAGELSRVREEAGLLRESKAELNASQRLKLGMQVPAGPGVDVKELERLGKELKSMDAIVSGLNEENKRLRESAKAAATGMVSADAHLTLRGKYESLVKEAEALRGQCLQLRGAAMREVGEATNARVRGLEEQLESAAHSARVREEKIRAEAQGLRVQLAAQSSASEQRIAELQEDVTDKRSELRRLRRTADSSAAEIRRLHDKLDSFTALNSELKAQVDSLEQTLEKKQRARNIEVRRFERKMRKLEGELAKLREVSETPAPAPALKSEQGRALVADVGNERPDEAESRIRSLEEEIEEAEGEAESARKLATASAARVEAVQKALEAAKQRERQLTMELERARSRTMRNGPVASTSLSMRIEALQASQKAGIRKHAEQMAALRAKARNDAQAASERFSKQLAEKNRKIEAYRAELDLITEALHAHAQTQRFA